MSVELKQYEDKMNKTLDSLSGEYTTIRAGRANPHVLDKITVDYYGTQSNLQSVANISVSEARTLVIQPWEASLIKEIEKAIMTSDLGLTPNNDGKAIRLTFPELTEERRKELVKDVRKKGENAKLFEISVVMLTMRSRRSRKQMKSLRMRRRHCRMTSRSSQIPISKR